MIDHHIHFGHWEDIYFEPVDVVSIVMEAGVDALCVSSTTSCKEGVTYAEVEKEFQGLFRAVNWNTDVVRAFFWCLPAYTGYISIESAFQTLPYKGIKLHLLAHNWDFNNPAHLNALHALFDFASRNSLPVLVHTGESGIDSADKFEAFFRDYAAVKCILAHCRPLEKTIPLLRDYPNVYGDTAFLSEENAQKIKDKNLSHKILPGSDFPITHYFSSRYGNEKTITLREQYNRDFTRLQSLSTKISLIPQSGQKQNYVRHGKQLLISATK